jgi:hypothetical protein
MEAKMLLSRLFQTYKITLSEGYELIEVQKVFLQPKGEVLCVLEPINS